MKTMNELVSWFQLEYPNLVDSMRNSSHHLTHKDQQILDGKYDGGYGFDLFPVNINPYHQEGTVFEHTMMVCKQAEEASYVVRIAALLHDIGKPSTRAVNAENGRVSFYNHDAVSAFMSLEILKRPELGLEKEQQIEIFNMIALHTQIFKLSVDQLEKAFTNKDEELDRFVELGKADSNGRFYSIASESKIDEVLWAKYKKPVEKEKEVIVLVGLPGAGKSRWKEENYPEAFPVSRDHCLMDEATQYFDDNTFTYSEAWGKVDQKAVDKALQARFSTAKHAGSTGTTIIVDMTHMSKKSRRKSLSHFNSDYKKKCVVFLTDMQTLSLRLAERKGKTIDKSVIDKMIASFYPPTLSEFDEIEYIL